MAKKKNDKGEKEGFDLIQALNTVNPLQREGLGRLCLSLGVKTQEEFDKIKEDYGSV